MIDDIAIGLAGAIGIFLFGPAVDSILRRAPGRWIAPEAWIVVLVVWNVGVAAAVSSAYDPTADIDVGAAPGVLRETATIAGTPLIALGGLAILLRWRLIWSRRRVPLVWALAALAAVDLVSVLVGFAGGNDAHYIASDAWRWAVLPLWGVLAIAEERPRPAVLLLAAPAIAAFSTLLDAYGSLQGIGEGAELGPLSTLTFAATAVVAAWVAKVYPRALPGVAVVLALELAISFSSPQRTAAAIALLALAIALGFAWRLGSLTRTAAAFVVPPVVLAVAVLTIGSVRDYAQPTIDRWEQRAEEELAPSGDPEVVPAPAPAPAPEAPAPTSPQSAIPETGEGRTVLAWTTVMAQDTPPVPAPAEEPETVLSFSTVGERREEVRRSRDWLLRGTFPQDVFRVVFGLGQGAQYSAPRLPALDTRSEPGFRHHIHLTYMSALVRNGLIGLVALLVALGLLLAAGVRSMRAAPADSWDGLAARVVLAAVVLMMLEMVTGFVFIGSMEGGVVVAAALALTIRHTNTIGAR